MIKNLFKTGHIFVFLGFHLNDELTDYLMLLFSFIRTYKVKQVPTSLVHLLKDVDILLILMLEM